MARTIGTTTDLLLATPLPQIRFLVSQVVFSIGDDRGLIFLFHMAHEFAWRAHPQGTWHNRRAFGYQRPGCNDRSRSNLRPIQDDRSHADQTAVLDRTAVERDRMPH